MNLENMLSRRSDKATYCMIHSMKCQEEANPSRQNAGSWLPGAREKGKDE